MTTLTFLTIARATAKSHVCKSHAYADGTPTPNESLIKRLATSETSKGLEYGLVGG
jgi:hypothetical protein